MKMLLYMTLGGSALATPLLYGPLGDAVGPGWAAMASAVTAAAVVVALVVLIVAVVAIAKRAKEKRFDGVRAKGGGTAAAHSHDRLQGYAGNESGFEHWKKQLDGFLEAGIIDRSEYRALIERRRR